MIRQDHITTLRNVVVSIKEGGRYTKAQYIEHLNKIADTIEENFLGVDEVVAIMAEYGIDPKDPKPAINPTLYNKWLTDKYNKLQQKCQQLQNDKNSILGQLTKERADMEKALEERDSLKVKRLEKQNADLINQVGQLQSANDQLRKSNALLFDHVTFGKDSESVEQAKQRRKIADTMKDYNCTKEEAKKIIDAKKTIEKYQQPKQESPIKKLINKLTN